MSTTPVFVGNHIVEFGVPFCCLTIDGVGCFSLEHSRGEALVSFLDSKVFILGRFYAAIPLQNYQNKIFVRRCDDELFTLQEFLHDLDLLLTDAASMCLHLIFSCCCLGI